MLKAVFFDLDGTLLPMDQDVFLKEYLGRLAKKVSAYGYDPKELIAAIWEGTGEMVKNDGSRLNADVFWDSFTRRFGKKAMNDVWLFDDFYRNEFLEVQSLFTPNPKASSVIRYLQEKKIRLLLATNPVFPAIATETRIRWAGLDVSDFETVTTYENIGFCKPNPEYYAYLVEKSGLSAEECLMVGNDVEEDMIASAVGMKTFLLTDCLLNRKNLDMTPYPKGDFDALFAYLQTELS